MKERGIVLSSPGQNPGETLLSQSKEVAGVKNAQSITSSNVAAIHYGDNHTTNHNHYYSPDKALQKNEKTHVCYDFNTQQETKRKSIIINHYLKSHPKIPITMFFKKEEYLTENYLVDGQRANCCKIDLKNEILNNSDFSSACFQKAILEEATLDKVKFDGTFLDDADITNAKKLRSSQLAKAIYTNLIIQEKDKKDGERKAVKGIELRKQEEKKFIDTALEKAEELRKALIEIQRLGYNVNNIDNFRDKEELFNQLANLCNPEIVENIKQVKLKI